VLPCAALTDGFFTAVPEAVIAIQIAGTMIYYPAMGIYDLEYMDPGAAYYVYLTADAEYTFPGCELKTGDVSIAPCRPEYTTSWNDVSYTGNTHIIAFSQDVLSTIELGDVIGAFTNNGICAGMTTYTGQGAGLSVFGNDITTAGIDGFEADEALSYKLFRSSTNTEFTMDVTYSIEAPNYDGLFATNGLSIVSDLTLKATGIYEVGLKGLSIYPNPTNGIVNIVVTGLDHEINYVVTNAQGQEIYQGRLLNSQEIDLSAETKGVYFIKFISNDILRIEKVVIK